MKKLLTLALGTVVLAAFTGLSAAQERKAGEKPLARAPYADKVTLSTTKNVASKTGCPATARPGYSGNAADIFPGQALLFVPPTAVSSPAPPWITDPKGERKVTIKFGQTVQATMKTPKGTVTSNNFACGGPLLPEK